MDDNCKKKLANVRKLIKETNFGQALEQLQVMSYKYSKVFQVHLMLGLCSQKMDKLDMAQRAYLQVLDLQPDQPNALKELVDIYSRLGNQVKSTQYLIASTQILKKSDPKKYREAILKLVEIYEKDDNMQKLDPIFQEYVNQVPTITQDFVAVGAAYFRVAVKNQCFFLQRFEMMGVWQGQVRSIDTTAKEALNKLLIDVYWFLRAIMSGKGLTQRELTDSLVEVKMYFPQATGLLMVLFMDQFCMGQLEYSPLLLGQIYKLLTAFFDNTQNCYSKMQFLQPQMFTVCMLFSAQYLLFFKEFFSLDLRLVAYLPALSAQVQELGTERVRQDYRKRVGDFVLKECRQLQSLSRYGGIENRLEQLKNRILRIGDSFLQQVVAKIALNCISNYDRINDMKNLLKLRIKNLPAQSNVPHLYKYYYEYVIKMARIFKSLDQQLPLFDLLNYIHEHDPNDQKYHIQLIWLHFCQDSHVEPQKAAQTALSQLQKMCAQLEPSLRSPTLRKIAICKLFLKDTNIKIQLEQALGLERSFENLQCLAFYYYMNQQTKKSLKLLKEAFILNQMHYHTNRLLFLLLLKENSTDAIDFLLRIKEGFPSVFWVNYLLAISKHNQGKYVQAQALMSGAVQCFNAGTGDKVRFSYQRVRDVPPFSLQYMIKQNKYTIFFDQIVFPEDYIYQQCASTSNLYFKHNFERSLASLYLKEAQLLKVLGRTSSALSFLQQAHTALQLLGVTNESEGSLQLQWALVKKEYSTVLFYMGQFKEAQQMLFDSYSFVQQLLNNQQSKGTAGRELVLQMDNQIKALSFQISVERLGVMMRFQSRQFIDQYLDVFSKKAILPSRPSLNFYKNKYQFHILQFVHKRHNTLQVSQAVDKFLDFYGLSLKQRQSVVFGNRLQQLSDSDRKNIRECIQDYYIVRYLSGESTSQEEVLNLVKLMPKSSTLYILLGLWTQDIKLRTAAYLRCIQLDKQSVISIDILASLYLKQKKYLQAAKLFLKSLELDVLNPKCYLGLAVCLCCMLTRVLADKIPQQLQIVQKCLSRVNSYLQYLRVNDPSQHYHLLSFVKLLMGQEERNSEQARIVLQGAHSACWRYRQSVFGELLNQALGDCVQHNPWLSDQQVLIVQRYLQGQNGNISQIVSGLVKRIEQSLNLLTNNSLMGPQMFLKSIEKELHELSVCINLGIKHRQFIPKLGENFINVAQNIQKSLKSRNISIQTIVPLLTNLKQYLYDYAFLQKQHRPAFCSNIQALFNQISSYSYLATYGQCMANLGKEISLAVLKNPVNAQLRKIQQAYLVSQGKHLRKAKLPYTLDLLNKNNENAQQSMSCFRKIFMINRDPLALCLHIQHCWNNSALRLQSHITLFLEQLTYLHKVINDRPQLKLKVTRMRVEMVAYWLTNFSQNLPASIGEQEMLQVNKMKAVFEIIQQINKENFKIEPQIKTLKQFLKGSSEEFDWWMLAILSNYIVRTRETPNFQTTLASLQKQAPTLQLKGFALLMRCCLQLSLSPEDQNELVDQIVSITQLVDSAQKKVHPNTEVILHCSKHLLTNNYEHVQAQLSRAEMLSLATYSDRVLVNMFEVIKSYKVAQSNPNAQGVVQQFMYICDCMLSLVKQPLYKGFILSLKGILRSLVAMSETKERDIKMGMLFNPMAARSLIG